MGMEGWLDAGKREDVEATHRCWAEEKRDQVGRSVSKLKTYQAPWPGKKCVSDANTRLE